MKVAKCLVGDQKAVVFVEDRKAVGKGVDRRAEPAFRLAGAENRLGQIAISLDAIRDFPLDRDKAPKPRTGVEQR